MVVIEVCAISTECFRTQLCAYIINVVELFSCNVIRSDVIDEALDGLRVLASATFRRHRDVYASSTNFGKSERPKQTSWRLWPPSLRSDRAIVVGRRPFVLWVAVDRHMFVLTGCAPGKYSGCKLV